MVATGAGEPVGAKTRTPGTTKANNNNHLNNDTLQSPPLLNPGQPLSTRSGHQTLNNKPYTEKAKTVCYHPTGGRKVSMCTVSQGPCIYPRKYKRLPGGRQTKVVCKTVGRTRCSPLPTGSHRQGYRLPFREHLKLSWTPCIISMYSEVDKNNALSTSILDLLTINAIEKVNREHSLGFYSRLFLVPKPGNRWRPVIDLSSLNHYLMVSKFKMETPESIRTSLR